MFTVSKEFNFSAAHRLNFYEAGRCQHLHGHNYKVRIMLGKKQLGEDGMVVNFTKMNAIQRWLDENWDHATILQSDDQLASDLAGYNLLLYLMDDHPTVENMCKALWKTVSLIFTGLDVILVTIYETDTCVAQYDGRDHEEPRNF